MRLRKHRQRKEKNAASPSWSVRRALQESKKENSDLHHKVKQIEEEKLQLEEKCRQLEARNKEVLEEKKLYEEERRILQDFERRNLELREFCNEMNDKRSELKREKEIKLQHKHEAMRGRFLDLKVRFDKTECENKELIEQQKRHEKERRILQDLERRNLELREFCNEMNDKRPELESEKEIPMVDKPMDLWETYVDLKVRFDEIECKNILLLEEKQQYEEERRILQDFERRNLELREFCNEMNDKTPQLEREKKILEKQSLRMQRKINDQWLKINDLKSQITEMQAQKQQQEKTREDLLRMHQEFKRKIELLEEMHNKKQERNTDMCKANLMEEATSKDLKERTSLKEMEQRCQKLEKEIEEKNDQPEISIEESIKNLDKNVSRLTKKLFKGLIKEFGSTEQVMNAALACDSSFDEAILKHLKINFWVLMIPPQKSRIARFFSPLGRAITKPFRCCFKGSDD